MKVLFRKDLIFIEKGSMVCGLNEKAPTTNRGLFETTTNDESTRKCMLISIYEKKYISILFLVFPLIFSVVVSINFFMESRNG